MNINKMEWKGGMFLTSFHENGRNRGGKGEWEEEEIKRQNEDDIEKVVFGL